MTELPELHNMAETEGGLLAEEYTSACLEKGTYNQVVKQPGSTAKYLSIPYLHEVGNLVGVEKVRNVLYKALLYNLCVGKQEYHLQPEGTTLGDVTTAKNPASVSRAKGCLISCFLCIKPQIRKVASLGM